MIIGSAVPRTPVPAPPENPGTPGGPVPPVPPSETPDAPAPKQWDAPPAMELKPATNYRAVIDTPDGKLGVQLLPGAGPNAVNNFMFLAKQGFYKNVPVHRMIPDFMMQTGDAQKGDGTGGPGYDLPDDKVPEGAKYAKGILAMANTGRPNSGGSQFFVMLDDYPLPPTYSIFGYVTGGRDVLDKINARKVADNGQGEESKPVEPFAVTDVTVSESPVA